MNQENTLELPADFDGVYRFTNFTDEDFTTLWNSVEYTFPKMSTTPMIIQGESLENIQEIRKRFAKRLALREFYNGNRYEELNSMTNKSGVPPLINEEKELGSFIQKCLEPLPVGKISMKAVPKSRSMTSEHTKVVGEKETLKGNGTDAAADLDSLPE